MIGISGVAIGTLCAFDHHPRSLDDCDRRVLRHLGYAVVHVLDQRRRRLHLLDPSSGSETDSAHPSVADDAF